MTLRHRQKKRSVLSRIPWQSGFKIALLVALLFISFFSLNKVKETRDFPIHNVKIYGVAHSNYQGIQHALTPLVTKGFFAVQVDGVREELLQFPWVADASVWRKWPDQVVITIKERVPAARWNENGLLSVNGEIFKPDENSYPENLPQFIGPDGEQINMLGYYTKISRMIQPLHSHIARFELTPYLAWTLTFDNGMKVDVGYKDVLTRIHHFVKVYPKIVGERTADVDYIDLRYANGLAVKWKTTG